MKKRFYMEHIYSCREDVYHILLSIFGDCDVAEELTQNVLEHAWKGLDALKNDKKSKAWLNGIVRNEVRSYMKRKKNEHITQAWEPDNEYVAESFIPDSLAEKEVSEEAVLLLEQMDEKYRSIIKLHLIAEFSLREIAEMKNAESIILEIWTLTG